MKQIYLKPRGAFRAPPRSDTLFGLLAHAVRAVYGRASVERFLAPALEDQPNAPLYVTSAFPWLESERGRVHFFPTPFLGGAVSERASYVEDSEFLAYVTGQKATVDETPLLDGVLTIDRDGALPRHWLSRGGYFFLAAGPAEHYLEAALKYLERSGFGGGASRGMSHFDTELIETEFVRLAQPGERGVLLSLMHPTAVERELIAREALSDERIAWRIERRQGQFGGGFGRAVHAGTASKAAIAMLAEGSILPRGPARACGGAPRVGGASDAEGEFPLLHSGFGFLVPLINNALNTAGASGAVAGREGAAA